MSQQLVCDGCGKLLEDKNYSVSKSVAITGERANGMGGGGLPDGRFDWCTDCATIGFTAVRQARGALKILDQ